MTGDPFNATPSAWAWEEPTDAQWKAQQQSLQSLQWDVLWMDFQEWINGNGKYWLIAGAAVLLLGKRGR